MAPFPSAADLAYLILPIAAGITLLFLSTGLSRTSKTRLMLDGICVAASFTIIVWATVLDEVSPAARPANSSKSLWPLAYPVLDAAVLTIAAVVLTRARPGQRRTLALLTSAMVCIAVADVRSSTWRRPNATPTQLFVDVGWLAGLLLMGVAAALGRGFSVRENVVAQPPSWASVWLPFIPVVAASWPPLLKPS